MGATGVQADLERLAIDANRVLSIDAVQKANIGHPGAPMGLAPVAYTLFTRLLKHNPRNPGWIDRDRFVLSAGHASALLYSTLYLSGYPITLEEVKNFRQLGSPTAGHPEYWDVPGIEATTGPLGQGISMAVGLAAAEAHLAATFNTDGHTPVDHHTWVIASDGDIQEGVASEASSLAGHLGLGKLIVFYDDNKVQLASATDICFSEDVTQRYEAYGWQVLEVNANNGDRHQDLDPEEIETVARQALANTAQPTLIRVHSHIGYGSPNKQDSSKAHGAPLGEDEVKLTKEAYGYPSEEPFFVPPEALEHWRQTIERGANLEDTWNETFNAYKQAAPQQAAELERIVSHAGLPQGWNKDGPLKFDAAEKPLATRAASGKAIQWAAARVPELVGGSADLASSNVTDITDGGDFLAGSYAGRNLHFGVREHAMGAIVNGLGLHGLRAFGGTFLTFSDYMRGAVRLSALQQLPSTWVWTHDSIGLGEDGPTHQPVEHLAALRAIPNLHVVRPADANETALAWQFALDNFITPTALALSRQGVPIIDRDKIPADAIEKGAYVLEDPADKQPDVILIATGSEVSLALEAAKTLNADGTKTRVVSAPCLETFAAADAAYQESVLPKAVQARVAVEAAVRLGWDRWIGPDGGFVGMEGFGASGPGPQVYEHFGITAEHVVSVAQETVARSRTDAS